MDRPNLFLGEAVNVGLSAIVGVTVVSGQQALHVRVNSGASAIVYLGYGASAQIGAGAIVYGITMGPGFYLNGAGTVYLSATGASAQVGIVREVLQNTQGL